MREALRDDPSNGCEEGATVALFFISSISEWMLKAAIFRNYLLMSPLNFLFTLLSYFQLGEIWPSSEIFLKADNNSLVA